MSGPIGLLGADLDQLGGDVDRRHPGARGRRGQRGASGAAGQVDHVAERSTLFRGGDDLFGDRRDPVADSVVTAR